MVKPSRWNQGAGAACNAGRRVPATPRRTRGRAGTTDGRRNQKSGLRMVASWATGLDCTPGPRARLSAVGVTGPLLTLPRSVALDGNSCPHELRSRLRVERRGFDARGPAVGCARSRGGHGIGRAGALRLLPGRKCMSSAQSDAALFAGRQAFQGVVARYLPSVWLSLLWHRWWTKRQDEA